MAIKQEFKYTVPDGQEYISFEDWIETLPQGEQDEFNAARDRQFGIRSEFVNSGTLQVLKTDEIEKNYPYIWKDADAAKKNKPNDPVWLTYWDRYLKETNTTFEIIETEI